VSSKQPDPILVTKQEIVRRSEGREPRLDSERQAPARKSNRCEFGGTGRMSKWWHLHAGFRRVPVHCRPNLRGHHPGGAAPSHAEHCLARTAQPIKYGATSQSVFPSKNSGLDPFHRSLVGSWMAIRVATADREMRPSPLLTPDRLCTALPFCAFLVSPFYFATLQG